MENTLLASRILPPSYSPNDSANNRSQESTLSLEQGELHKQIAKEMICDVNNAVLLDGRLTLLVILTTAAGLAVVLLLFILLRFDIHYYCVHWDDVIADGLFTSRHFFSFPFPAFRTRLLLCLVHQDWMLTRQNLLLEIQRPAT